MQKLVFINGAGKEIDLSSGNFAVVNWEGLSNTDLNIQSQQVPFEDGGVFLDALMEQREIELTVAIYDGNDLELRYQKKRELISALNPKLGEGILTYTNDYLSKQIKAVPQIPLFENKNSNDAGTLKASVAFTCCDPYWEDTEEKVVNFSLGEVAVIDNRGDIPTPIKARFFTQNAVNPTIKNMNTNKEIEFQNTLEKTLNINTNMGQKSVYTENVNLETIGSFGKFTGVCFSKKKSMWVATTSIGDIFYSYNGTEWNLCKFETEVIANFTSVIYADELDLFVAVGQRSLTLTANCRIATSSDGITWTNRGNYGIDFSSVAYSSSLGLLIAVGWYYSGTVNDMVKSSDGITWETFGASEAYIKIIYEKALATFFAVGIGIGTKSTDGENWESFNGSGNGIAYSEKRSVFVTVFFQTIDNVNYPLIKRSTDGSTWTDIVLNNLPNVQLIDVSYSEDLDLFISTGSRNVILSSQDGITWNVIQESDDVDIRLNTSLYVKEQGKYLVMGTDSLIYSSSNGTSWNIVQNLKGTINGVAYSKKLDLFVAVGNNGLILTSEDGRIWNNKNSGIIDNLNAVTYSENLGIFIAVGVYNKILKSTDAENWEEVFSFASESYELFDVAYSEKLHLFVACGVTSFSGDVIKSSDGINWEYVTISGGFKRCYRVIYSEEKELFVVGSTNSEYIRSSDGINWIKSTVPNYDIYDSLSSLAYSKENDCFFLLQDDKIYKSQDCIYWNEETISQDINFINCVIYSEYNKTFFALNTIGEVYTSINLAEWEKIKNQGTVLNCATVSTKDNNTVFGGESGIIMLSYYSSGENQIQYISADSDMGFNIVNGENRIILSCTSGDFSCSIIYRQKYIGV